MKSLLKTVAGICLLLAPASCWAGYQAFGTGEMQLPADPAERQGDIAGVVAFPAVLLAASALLFVKASGRERR